MKASRCVEIVAVTFLIQALSGGLLAQTPSTETPAKETPAKEIPPKEIPPKEIPEEMEFDIACNAAIAKLEDIKTLEAKTTPPQVNPKWPLSSPEYPPRSLRMNEEGTVFLSLLVNEQGKVAKARVAKSSGWPNLDHAALKETGYWHFFPARIANEPACMWISTPIVFALSDTANPPAPNPSRTQP